MFIGHYGPGYAAKAADRTIPLWVLFLAVQPLDVFWAIFVLTGIEKVRIVPGFTATNPLDLYFMPYTHGLPGAIGWSLLAAIAWRTLKGRDATRSALIVGAAVFSHWIFDLVVHNPDLPLWGDRYKVGLGLWNHPVVALCVEIAVLVSGLAAYLRVTERTKAGGTAGFVVFTFFLVIVQIATFFGAPPKTPAAAAITALAAYFVLAAIAGVLDARRGSSTRPAPSALSAP
jgi:hypothetical protein